jgi:hypothetical protein
MLTRAQYIAGDASQGEVLEDQVQGVKAGVGVEILPDGTINFASGTSVGVVKTNSLTAFNSYIWPNSPLVNGQLVFRSGNNLSWGRVPGFGLVEDGTNASNLKAALPISTTNPVIGTSLGGAPEGGLYWNSENGNLFINYGGNWIQTSYGPADLNEALLTGTYTLYVNSQIGSDIYVTGIYDGTATPVVTNQMTQAGYTAQKPFKTLQRAALEVARIQNGPGQDSQSFDRFVIKCAAGVALIDNAIGSASVSAWVNDTIPSAAQLRAMNSVNYPGVILPRGVSVIGEDLRKTVIRPLYVPPKTGDIDTDRGSILRITGGGFFFNFTFKDKEGLSDSHHLLDCFSFVSDTDLDDYYAKVQTIFAQSYPDVPVNPGETEIVAPQPPGTPEQDTDGIMGASPYIFNCSVRSAYGLCGINADGNDVTGFKSMVTAQFTGVSLQRDLSCWQKYNSGPKTWTNTIANYDSYIALDPNNVRMDPTKRSFHIKAINEAFIQEVSVFAIGQGIHHWVKSGGEISITNSNSSFGGCAALAEGYKAEAFPQDTNWNVATINLATNMIDQTTVVNNISLGVVSAGVANNAINITLTQPLIDSEVYPGVPQVLASKNYTFASGSYLWIENSSGPDWRAPLSSAAWSSSNPENIQITVPMGNQRGDFPGVDGAPNLVGSKVYVRRLTDSRSLSQRRYSINATNTDSNTRTPLRDYVIQTTLGSGGGIIGLLPDSDMVIVNKSGPIPIGTDPVVRKAQVILERANPSNVWTAGNYYRPGETVKYQNKHFTCVVKNSDAAFDTEKWSQSYVHMRSDYNAYDFFINTAPVIYFDNDTDGDQPTTNCGYNLTTCWSTDPKIISQYTTATDYRGVYQFLIGIGFTAPQVTSILLPVPTASRELNPASNVDMKGYVPNGAANLLSNWPIEFRRPSVLRMFGHAWEWAGFLNYTKALPRYQGDLSPQNQFTYYFTNELGGRVYATGFNQEGFFVTPAGLTDLSTGSTIGISDIGNPFSGVDLPTYYPALTVDSLNVTTNMEFSSGCQIDGAPIFSPEWYTNFRSATETDQGIIRLSTTQESQQLLSTDTAITPYSLSYAVSSAIKSVVNLRLSLSGSSPVPSSNQLNSTNLYIHPYNGSEIALYNTTEQVWQIVPFSGVLTRSLAPASSPDTVYDIYVYNGNASNPLLAPNLLVDFVAWANPQSPPSRSSQNGIICKLGDLSRRFVGLVRTTTAGTSTMRLGGAIYDVNSADYPRLYLANYYNLYDARAVYFFGSSWNSPTANNWALVPGSVYPVAPRISFIQAGNTLVTCFLDIYNNFQSPPNVATAYVAPGLDLNLANTPFPVDDAFYGETQVDNQTTGSQWARALDPGAHDLYYLYKQIGNSIINEHLNHGMILIAKV